MADLSIKTGQTIITQDGREGVVRYIGPLHIAAGEWLGLELPDETGKNDGSVKGQRYFQCAPGFGIFVRKESAVHVVKQTPQEAKPKGASASNGSVVKPRPSSGVTADVARKRQSLMSPGAAQAAGSRLSLRVWLKSSPRDRPS
jgi:dynactin 1